MPEGNESPFVYNFEWDENKNRQNIKKHGLDFADAEEMFRGVVLFWPDVREDYGENRWTGIGKIRGRTAVVYIYGPWSRHNSHHFAEKGKPP